MQYFAKFTPDANGNDQISFRDIPEALSTNVDGYTLADSIAMAQDALVVALDFYFEDERMVPMPSAQLEGEHAVELPPELAAKVVAFNANLAG